MSWTYLSIAIVAEIIATSALKSAEGFTRLWPSLVTIVGYAIAFFCLSLSLRHIPVGIAYAIWSGVGIVAISIIGFVLFKQSLDLAGFIGIGLIVAGLLYLTFFLKAVSNYPTRKHKSNLKTRLAFVGFILVIGTAKPFYGTALLGCYRLLTCM